MRAVLFISPQYYSVCIEGGEVRIFERDADADQYITDNKIDIITELLYTP